jgi:hypothetical protein
MSRAPVRLLDQGNLSEHERALLESAQASAPVEYDVEAGAARFRSALTALTAAGAAAATVHGVQAANGAGAAASKALLVKLVAKLLLGVSIGAAVAGGGLVTGILLARHRIPVETSPTQIAAAEQVPTAERSGRAQAVPLGSLSVESSDALALPTEPMAKGPGAVSRTKHPGVGRGRSDSSHPSAESAATAGIANEAEEGSDSVGASTPPAAERAPSRQSLLQSAQPQAERPAPVDHPLSEVAAIAMAKDLVERDPKAALKVLNDLRRNHPRGYFVEERQALTVLALAGAGQTAAAQQEAQAFLRVFPNGPFSDRVRAVLRTE